MILGIALFVASGAAVFAVIAVHEFGHYLAGAAGGIPRGAMRIRLFTFPQHVALQCDRRWLHPIHDYDHYAAAAGSFLKDGLRAGSYVAGGLLTQTVAFVCLVFALSAFDLPRLWITPIVCASASVPILYLGYDLIVTQLVKKPSGDFSFLWRISPMASVALTLFVIGVHAGTLIRFF